METNNYQLEMKRLGVAEDENVACVKRAESDGDNSSVVVTQSYAEAQPGV